MENLDDNAAAAPLRPRRAPRRRVLPTVFGLLVVGGLMVGAVWVANHPQPIIDQVNVWQYEPDAVIAGHVERLQLTDHGRFLYYASRPAVSSGERFASDCPIDHDEQEFGVLGCYVHADKAIFLFDVTDARLDGAEEVVAAHEMLHAAWDRMGEAERDRLTLLLDSEYERLIGDPEFSKRMSFYALYEPGQRANELHSIVGTEVATVSDALEEYYAQYFVDRGTVTALHSASYAVFVDLQAQADSIVSQMEELRLSVEADYASYTSGYDRLNKDIETFNQRAQTGFYSDSTDAFMSARDRLVERGQELDDLYASVTDRVDQYDALAIELATVNETSAELQYGLNIGGDARDEVDVD